jgi:hypothetical protein
MRFLHCADVHVSLPVQDRVVAVPPYFTQCIPSATCRKEEMAAVVAVCE